MRHITKTYLDVFQTIKKTSPYTIPIFLIQLCIYTFTLTHTITRIALGVAITILAIQLHMQYYYSIKKKRIRSIRKKFIKKITPLIKTLVSAAIPLIITHAIIRLVARAIITPEHITVWILTGVYGIYAVYWILAIPTTLFTKKQGKTALEHSYKKIQGKWMKTAGYTTALMTPLIIYMGFIITLAILLTSFEMHSQIGVFVQTIFNILGATIDTIQIAILSAGIAQLYNEYEN